MAVTQDKPGPYAPPSVILDLIARLRSKGLPSPVNADVLERAGVSVSLIPRTLQTLQTLDLIGENGEPTKTCESIRLAPEGEFQQRLTEWLNSAYADVISFVDPAKDNETAVRDAFRSYKPVGQQPRMVSLFLGLYEATGVSPKKSSQPRTARQVARPRAAAISATTHRKPSISRGSSDVPAPVAGLLSSLPHDGHGWTQDQRDKFLTIFRAVLDFCFPIIEAEATNNSSGDNNAE